MPGGYILKLADKIMSNKHDNVSLDHNLVEVADVRVVIDA